MSHDSTIISREETLLRLMKAILGWFSVQGVSSPTSMMPEE
jgi:hypothetical protein